MKDIRNVLIVGGGMMGRNIAFVMTANPALRVVVTDIADTDIHAGIRVNCRQLIEHGVISENELEARLDRIAFTTDMRSTPVRDADFVIEAVFEDMTVKRETFKKLEAVCLPDTIFCTNTSVMSPSEISAEMTYRERFAGTHFWNPAHLIPLVEVVKSDATSDETADTVMALLQFVGKKPVLCKRDVPGFIANRMQHALWREAISIVENGIADAETVDMAVKYSFGLRLPQIGIEGGPASWCRFPNKQRFYGLGFICQSKFIKIHFSHPTFLNILQNRHIKEKSGAVRGKDAEGGVPYGMRI